MNDDMQLPDDFWMVATPSGSLVVSAATARAIEAALDEEPPPRWISFVSTAGTRARIRSRHVGMIEESTAASRAWMRAFNRQRADEKRAEGWTDDTNT